MHHNFITKIVIVQVELLSYYFVKNSRKKIIEMANIG